ncbi:O-antigen ligase family protein [Patescibacteria group bacterium]|nr:O-antigen ligase family protein [Patescibacteria group bacterium]MBU1472823.1 O-antigen ligase family protein [Patescibacteria group bacterium]MBU2460369.1 O-antigen ligase family protein [Patescibacteria group bacterium]MBU2544053.1 O-antigen ligase family protein [Patescibacteria group bacterium]
MDVQLITSLFFISLLVGNIIKIGIGGDASLYIHDVVLLLLVSAFSLQQYRKGVRAIPRLAWYVLGFAAIAICSLVLNARRFTSVESGQSLLYLVRWLLYASLYWITAFSQYPSLWLTGLYGAGMGVAVLGFLQLWLYPDLRNLYYLGWDPHFRRMFSTLLDPNFTGIIIVLTFFLGLLLYPRIAKKAWIVLGEAILVIALLTTYSRSSFLAFGLGIAALVLWQKAWRCGALLLAVFAAGVILMSGQTEGQRLTRSASAYARIGNWTKTIALVKKSPIVGYGFNTLRFVRGEETNGADSAIPSRAGSGVDNSILFLLATTGIVGAVYYLWLLCRMVRLASHPSVSASFVAILVHSMFVNSLFYPWVMIWMWIVIGVRERELAPRQKSARAKFCRGVN